MITLKEDSKLNFVCEHCHQPYSKFTLNIAVFLYGAALLGKKDKGYLCFTCPTCMKSLLIKINSLRDLHMSLQLVAMPDGKRIFSELRYYSSIVFSPRKIKEIVKYDVPVWYRFLSDDGKEIFVGSLDVFIAEQNQNLETEYLCSYPHQWRLPIGYLGSVWWFRPENLEAFVAIENKANVKVFPRYYNQPDFFEKIDNFCWEFALGKKQYRETLEQSKVSADQLTDMVNENGLDIEELAKSNPNISIPELVDSLEKDSYRRENPSPPELKLFDILTEDPAPPEFSGSYPDFWKIKFPFRGKSLPYTPADLEKHWFDIPDQIKNQTEMVRMVSEDRKPEFLDYLSVNYIKFINDYVEIVKLKDFSYGAIVNLKLKYLENFLHTIQKGTHANAQYAFYQEGPAWTITFMGETIRGLDGIGFKYIHHLVRNKGQVLSTQDLMPLNKVAPSLIKSPEKTWLSENQKPITGKDKTFHVDDESDYQAYRDFNERIVEIDGLIAKSQDVSGNNLDNLSQVPIEQDLEDLYKEKEAILSQLKVDFGLHGHVKRTKDALDNDRDAIGRAITRAINSMKKYSPKIYEHFKKAIKGPFSNTRSYHPDVDIDWE